MIVCKECGHQNEDDDLFCGNCPAFLEYSGERIGGPEPVQEEAGDGRPTGAGDADPARDQRHRPPAADGAGGAPGAGLRPPGAGAPSIGADRRADRAARRRRREPATNGRRRSSPSPTRCNHPTFASRSRRGRPKRSAHRPRPRDRRSPSRRRAARSTPATSSAACAARATIPQRNYCRRCGSTLAEATVARTRWFRRRPKQSKKVVAAGDRPGRPGRSTSGGDAARGAPCPRQGARAASPTSSGSWPCSRSSGSASGSWCRASGPG